ncbi:beta-galactosidase [Mucilaginibacter sp. PPCGB 2223]|uniref:glycoside hydrolase family 35 protein n=1 Tax=Mucilaginibacter sp. PPCGB 2223 TaxID=1886027 RepID=UPI000826FF90|nr:beta-galactosidase family protein [Mucilaginibacter sp. PPCGB 2223]OCX53737.1 beta-galactosidase [Mucilaginibacter sp. PPCGB 2223]
MKLKLLALITGALILVHASSSAQSKHTFALGDSTFLLDGKPFQIISGEMHYPRVPREAWRARMKMARAMGLNTIGTYVFWNLHEPQKGQFDFEGNNDIVEFVKIAREEGLWVILRPSPYVCAEWEFGGYPYWLQNEKGLIVRSREPQYLKEYEAYIKEIGKRLAPYQINHGGNILMVQVENEYGFYSNDLEYMKINKKMFEDAGFDGLLYTCDPMNTMKDGHIPGLLPGINGQDNPAKVKRTVNANHDGKGPYFISEWYPAWFDWWGTPHHTVPAVKYTGKLDSVLANGISINMYMFHGGTSRGFMNGANFKDNTPYEPQVSSYDYDAPLDEAGNPTEKFMAFRGVIEKHLPKGAQLPPVPAARPTISISAIKLNRYASLEDILPVPQANPVPLTFEDIHQDYGFVLYRTTLNGAKNGVLKLKDLRDYAVVMVNGKEVGTLDRRMKQDSMQVILPAGKVTLDILVENLGRINFGKYLLQNKKGITGKVLFDGAELKGWNMYSLPFKTLTGIKYQSGTYQGDSPVLKKGTFSLQTVADTYLDMSNWGKGVVWVNGHNLGRYWRIGPQQTVYLPAEWLKKGQNEIEIFEQLSPRKDEVKAVEKPILDKLQN